MSKHIPTITAEECAEVIQAITKCQRFGLFQKNPNTGVTNRDHLAEEIGQLQYMLSELVSAWNLDENILAASYYNKKESLIKYAEYEV